MRPTLTGTELLWIVQALNHEIAAYENEVAASHSDLVCSLGKVAIDGRTGLVQKLNDLMAANAKQINII